MTMLTQIDKLEQLMQTMTVPSSRRSVNPPNARWLHRNLRINNGSHPDIDQAMSIVRQIISNRPRAA